MRPTTREPAAISESHSDDNSDFQARHAGPSSSAALPGGGADTSNGLVRYIDEESAREIARAAVRLSGPAPLLLFLSPYPVGLALGWLDGGLGQLIGASYFIFAPFAALVLLALRIIRRGSILGSLDLQRKLTRRGFRSAKWLALKPSILFAPRVTAIERIATALLLSFGAEADDAPSKWDAAIGRTQGRLGLR